MYTFRHETFSYFERRMRQSRDYPFSIFMAGNSWKFGADHLCHIFLVITIQKK